MSIYSVHIVHMLLTKRSFTTGILNASATISHRFYSNCQGQAVIQTPPIQKVTSMSSLKHNKYIIISFNIIHLPGLKVLVENPEGKWPLERSRRK
jgi:hypothetical protein